MKIGHNDIALRPRFELVLGISKEKALKGKPQMIQLHQFMMECVGIYAISADNQTA